jgi:hypothetical protein
MLSITDKQCFAMKRFISFLEGKEDVFGFSKNKYINNVIEI